VSYCNICIVYGFVMQINTELIISRKNQSKHTLFSSQISYMFPPNSHQAGHRKKDKYIHTQLYWACDLNALHALLYKKYIHYRGR